MDEEFKICKSQFVMSNSVLNEVVTGKRSISIEYALKIEADTGIPAYYLIIWINMQSQYDM